MIMGDLVERHISKLPGGFVVFYLITIMNRDIRVTATRVKIQTTRYLTMYDLVKHAERESWREGRRIVGFGVLLSSLKNCISYKLWPIPLTYLNIVGRLKKGLNCYLYVKCLNTEYGHVN